MNTSPAPDVDRVLDRMGRAAFGYRSFPNPTDDDGAIVPSFGTADDPPAALFSLVGDALPETAATVAPVPPPVAAPPADPFSQRVAASPKASVARSTPLAGVFRILSGNTGDVPTRTDAVSPEPAFPFRRR